MAIDPEGDIPVYVQLADLLRGRSWGCLALLLALCGPARAQTRAKVTGSTVTMTDAVAAVRAGRDRHET